LPAKVPEAPAAKAQSAKVAKRDERNILRNSIAVMRVMGDVIGSLLGPKGGLKMLVDKKTLETKKTADPAIIMDKMFIDHSSKIFMVDAGLTVKREVGDGVTTSVILLSSLLDNALKLIERGVHPSTISRGYQLSIPVLSLAKDLSVEVDPADADIIRKVVFTAANKIPAEYRASLSELVVDATMALRKGREGRFDVDIRALKLSKQEGGSPMDTTLVRGCATPMDIMNLDMPRRVEDARILLVDSPIQFVKPKFDSKVYLDDPQEWSRLNSIEHDVLKGLTKRIVDLGVNVVMCQKSIDEEVAASLARHGVIAVRFVSEYDLECLSKAIGAPVTKDIESLDKSCIGHAGLVEQREMGGTDWLFFEDIESPQSLTILIRGSDLEMMDITLSSLGDSMFAARDVMRSPRVVGGGGAFEMELAMKIRKRAMDFSGREQLAFMALADSLEEIPAKLAENSGMDRLDTILALRELHGRGRMWMGVDASNRRLFDVREAGIYDLLEVKEQAMKTALETAAIILRVDRMLAK
jgi:chaperonin GroEL (HSP60 family)